MMLISKLKNNNHYWLAIGMLTVTAWLLFPFFALAQVSQSLSVSPTLFEMTANPTQVWQSSVKVANTNSYPLTLYARVVNFAPQGEKGTGKFIPVLDSMTEGSTLAEWIDITPDSIVVPPESNMSIPFTVTVPPDAAPGGHFAAILVGTKPPETDETIQVKTSQVVTSLFFVRISGDVIEKGDIREFRVVKSYVPKPTADFELRFENKGNVHLQPQGNITIYNMWGEERGVIPINNQTNFGNVLPDSIRLFKFSWTGEQSLTDIGRFKAIATLAYGVDERNFVTRSTVFWVIPFKEVAITLGSILLIFFIISRIIKLYIRRMLILSGIDPDHPRGTYRSRQLIKNDRETSDVEVRSYGHLTAPVRSGVLDLKGRLKAVSGLTDTLRAVGGFIRAYRYFFLSFVGLIIIGCALWWYIDEASRKERLYEVTIDNGDNSVTMSSEDVQYERNFDTKDAPVSATISTASSTPKIEVSLVNVSGIPGAVAKLRNQLETVNYEITNTEVDLERIEARSVIVFSLDRQADAVALSKRLNGVLLSAGPASTSNVMTIFVGEDLAF